MKITELFCVTNLTLFVAIFTLLTTIGSLYFACKSNESTRESLQLTRESLTATRNSLEINEKTLKEAIESGSWAKMGKIYSITIYNCNEVVRYGSVLEDNKLMPINFITEPYIEDLAFIGEKFDNKTVEIIIKNLNDMYLANNYIYTLKELNIAAGAENDPQVLTLIRWQAKNHNRWIGEHVQNIKNNFCNIILDKFYNKLLEYKINETISSD